MNKANLFAIAALSLAAIGLAQAQAPAPVPGVVASRQTSMGLMYGSWNGMRVAVEAKADPKRFAIQTYAMAEFGKQIPALFPQSAGPGDKGLPAIWEDWAGFQRAAAALTAAAEAANTAAVAGDVAAFAVAVKSVTEACQGCHPRKFAKSW